MELALVVAVSICFPPILLFGFFVVNPRCVRDHRSRA